MPGTPSPYPLSPAQLASARAIAVPADRLVAAEETTDPDEPHALAAALETLARALAERASHGSPGCGLPMILQGVLWNSAGFLVHAGADYGTDHPPAMRDSLGLTP